MVQSINLLRNVGRFENVSAGAQLPFSRLTVFYAENARGKSTLAAVMRSLATGASDLITERTRLGTAQIPHIVIDVGVAPPVVFQNGAWSRTVPELVVFDDAFVAANVCSGIEVGATHRQNLHELIVGAQGIALARSFQDEVDRVERHNRELREREQAIPADRRGRLTVDQFVALVPIENLPKLIDEAEKRLAAGQDAGRVTRRGVFQPLSLPRIEIEPLRQLLAKGLAELDANALQRVQAHIERLGRGGEGWVGQGLRYADRLEDHHSRDCPFCAQNLSGSPLLAHYRGYFSEAYNALREDIVSTRDTFQNAQAGDVPASFERDIREAVELQAFWNPFAEVPALVIDTAMISRVWKTARELVDGLLERKANNPLDSILLPAEVETAIQEYHVLCMQIDETSAQHLAVNAQLELVKEQARDANLAVLASDLENLKAVEARIDAAIAPLCEAYTAERTAKAATERRRNAARQALDQHRQAAFPAYGIAINGFLQRFNASFRVGPIDAVNNRAGSSANYTLLIDGHPVPLAAAAGGPSFRNTLSAGDRSTLALAFFFASLQDDPQRARRIVVIDDPMTSLDEHRTLHTLQEMDRLAQDVASMIVLSHSKPFLLGLWDRCQQIQKTAVEVRRSGQGSTLAAWDVTAAMVTEHDRRHARALAYLGNADPAVERQVAESLRPMMESFCRVAYPADYPPARMLGQFHGQCMREAAAGNPIMDAAGVLELRALLDYANRYHHDSNRAYATELINDAELSDFTRRTLRFIKRP